MKKSEILLLSILFVALTAARLLMPEANFNPLGAVALMGGLLFGKRILAFTIPLGALLVGDLLMAASSPMYGDYLFSSSFFTVYLSYALIIVMGIALAKRPSMMKVIGGSIGAAVLFFIVSNFGSWLYFGMYPMNFGGLMECYAAGIPFFRPTVISQLAFSLGIYLVYAFSTQRKPVLI